MEFAKIDVQHSDGWGSLSTGLLGFRYLKCCRFSNRMLSNRRVQLWILWRKRLDEIWIVGFQMLESTRDLKIDDRIFLGHPGMDC